MELSNEKFQESLEQGKIVPYEQELLSNLRNYSYQGLPISIIVLSFQICNGSCYTTAALLTKGMTSFQWICGNVDIYPKDLGYPNHCWVEKDGYVYDPTDGFKWEKELYYQLYHPEVIESYNEETVANNRLYKSVMDDISNDTKPSPSTVLMLRYLEMCEKRDFTMNHKYLLEEIGLYFEKHRITEKIPDDIMKRYCDLLEETRVKEEKRTRK